MCSSAPAIVLIPHLSCCAFPTAALGFRAVRYEHSWNQNFFNLVQFRMTAGDVVCRVSGGIQGRSRTGSEHRWKQQQWQPQRQL